jgi:hypothetical protein
MYHLVLFHDVYVQGLFYQSALQRNLLKNVYK